MKQLKSCPFCGDYPELVNRSGFDYGYYENYVKCGCGVRGSVEANEEDAVNSWNTRLKVDKLEPRIVCAANRTNFTGEIALGVRHYDGFMHHFYDDHPTHGDPVTQGFIDQFGKFYTRQEAWCVAYKNSQIVRRVGGDDSNGGTLYSENLY